MQSQQLKSGSILKNSIAKTSKVQQSQNLGPKTPSKRSGEVQESLDMVNQSQNSNMLGNKLKQVTHADE